MLLSSAPVAQTYFCERIGEQHHVVGPSNIKPPPMELVSYSGISFYHAPGDLLGLRDNRAQIGQELALAIVLDLVSKPTMKMIAVQCESHVLSRSRKRLSTELTPRWLFIVRLVSLELSRSLTRG
jgi:hypothetical protein